MAANTTLIVAGLNYNQIRANLRDFIAAKPDFTDYDFQDSALGTLLDLLAYNTYYNAFYTNMAATESFIDTAQFYDSVVSRAKLVDYTPVSARGATANVRITYTTAVSNSSFTTITIAKNTQFTSTINSISYTFVTPKSYVIVANSTNGFRGDIELTEGFPITHRFGFSTSNTSFVLPNANVDSRSISVSVTSSGNTENYVKIDDILTVNSSSNIFYLEADRDFKYRVSFGDNVLGQRPPYNSTVAISYRVCNATRGNGANNFTAVGSVGGVSPFTLKINSRASGGADQENIESVRFNAPRMYETQNRAVTTSDYERIILRERKDIQAVSVWGGEDNEPPIYGKVYAAMKPYEGTFVSSQTKEQIKNAIKKYNVQSVDLEFVDPTYLYVTPTITVQYDSTATSKTASEIGNLVANRVITFESNTFDRFGKNFYFSKFLSFLDEADQKGIVGTSAVIEIQKRFVPSIVTRNSYTLNYNNKLVSNAVRSSSFTFQGKTAFFDDKDGIIRIYYVDGTSNVYLDSDAGTISYTNGIIVLKNFLPSAFVGNSISVYAKPVLPNIVPLRNQLLLLADTTVTVTEATTQVVSAKISTVATQGSDTTYETVITNLASSY